MRADGRPSNVAGALFFAALSLAGLGATALCAYEAYSLAADEEPITQRTRYVAAKYPRGTMLTVHLLGWLLGHLIWGPPDNGKEFWS